MQILMIVQGARLKSADHLCFYNYRPENKQIKNKMKKAQ